MLNPSARQVYQVRPSAVPQIVEPRTWYLKGFIICYSFVEIVKIMHFTIVTYSFMDTFLSSVGFTHI